MRPAPTLVAQRAHAAGVLAPGPDLHDPSPPRGKGPAPRGNAGREPRTLYSQIFMCRGGLGA